MSKYNSKKVIVDGIKFDSKKESRRYMYLKMLERAGTITDLKMQVPFVLFEKSTYGRKIKYIADFTYWMDGEYHVEDVKGYKTDIYKLKKRMVAEMFGIEIEEV